MSRVLILDDDVRRWSILRRFAKTLVSDPKFYEVRSSAEAIKMLALGQYFDLLILDHDLGGRIFVDPREENTGYQVARFIKDSNIQFGECVIHTLNDDAGRLMERTIAGQGRVRLVPIMRM